jgi:hypothetical protein
MKHQEHNAELEDVHSCHGIPRPDDTTWILTPPPNFTLAPTPPPLFAAVLMLDIRRQIDVVGIAKPVISLITRPFSGGSGARC